MPDRELTNEEYDFVAMALDIITQSDPTGPGESAVWMEGWLLDMGFTEQWIAEQITFGVAPTASSHVFA